jgi:hypothetical protein
VLRPEAIYIHSPALLERDIATPRVLKWANALVAGVLGVEWISDTSLVLVFSDSGSAFAALPSLLAVDDPDSEASALQAAVQRLLDIYDEASTDDLAIVARLRPVRPLTEDTVAPFARIALTSDIKPSKAAGASKFYARNGPRAGKVTALLHERMGGRQPRRERDVEDRDAELARLDAELDDLRDNEDRTDSHDTPSATTRRRSSPPAGRARGRRDDYDREAAERQRRADLDAELDAFRAGSPEVVLDDEPVQRDLATDLLESVASGGLRSVWERAGPLSAAERGDFVGYRRSADET